jgi:hypothetical protein
MSVALFLLLVVVLSGFGVHANEGDAPALALDERQVIKDLLLQNGLGLRSDEKISQVELLVEEEEDDEEEEDLENYTQDEEEEEEGDEEEDEFDEDAVDEDEDDAEEDEGEVDEDDDEDGGDSDDLDLEDDEDEDEEDEDEYYLDEDIAEMEEDEEEEDDDFYDEMEDDDEDEGHFLWSEYDEEEHTVKDIFEGLGCEEIEQPRPIHTDDTWKLLREKYLEVMGDKASIKPEQLQGNGFLVPVKVDYSAGKGRGVFAAAPIKEGTPVHVHNYQYTAIFRDGAKYREYLEQLPEELACDVIMWSYVEYQDRENQSDMIIGFEIDEASFTNGAISKDEKNVDFNYHALRDIAEGEEIIESYSDYMNENGWAKFGL